MSCFFFLNWTCKEFSKKNENKHIYKYTEYVYDEKNTFTLLCQYKSEIILKYSEQKWVDFPEL